MNKQMTKWYRGIVVVAWLCSASSALADPAVTYRTVALEGQAAGSEPGQAFIAFGYPLIDDFGGTSFTAYLSGPGVTTNNDFGFWADQPSGLQLWAREGSPAPGTEPGTTLALSMPNPAYGGDGTMAFRSLLQGLNMPSGANRGIWSNQTGTLELVARTGDTPPGFVAGSKFYRFDHTPSITQGGNLAFDALVINPDFAGPSGSQIQNTLWSFQEGALSVFARQGDPAPESEPGVNFFQFGPPAMTRNGSDGILVYANLDGPALPSWGGQGAWYYSSGDWSLVAKTQSPIPGPSPGYVFGNFLVNSLSLNNTGQTAFVAYAYQPQDPYDALIGVYAGDSNSLHLVAKEGDPAPGLPAGYTIDYVQNYDHAIPIDDFGRITFSANLAGPGVDNSNRSCILQGTDYSDLTLLVREGQPAPGAPDGVVFDFFPFQIDTNSLGQIAFYGRLAGPGFNSFNNGGLWAQDLDGNLQLIVRQGGTLEVAPGDIRIVDYFHYLGNPEGGSTYGRAINDRGEIAFSAEFTDGTSGVFVARVPEPASMVLFIAIVAIGIHRGRVPNRA